MNKSFCKKVSLLMVLTLCLSLWTGCSPVDSEKETEPSTPTAHDFKTVYTNDAVKALNQYNAKVPDENGKISYDINVSVGAKNYMRICIDTDVNLVGYIYYSNIADPGQSNQEKFFIEAGSTEFVTFLDAYRNGAIAPYEKYITKITLQNVDDTKDGTVLLKSVDFSDRKFDPDEMMYIDDGTLRVGTSLGFGGAITHISRINSNVVEYVDENGNMCIGRLSDTSGVTVVSEECNLVNIYDLGREIQQSFYWPVKQQHGYTPTSEQKYPGDLNYNPIQCGSAGSVGPQIVDYYCTENEIYVKAYGQDWYLVNQVDPTYFETWFTFGEDGVLIVKNRVTNFGQFVNTDGLEFVKQESPAFYSVYPLDYFYTETVQGTIFDNSLCAANGGSGKTSLNDSVSGRYYYSLPESQVSNKWAAFVTKDKFGLGIYNPYADYITAYSGISTTSYMNALNQQTHPDFYEDDYSSYIPSCYAYSYGYLNTAIYCQMIDFEPLEFAYAVYAGDVVEMRSAFKNLQVTGTLVEEDILWPTRDVG